MFNSIFSAGIGFISGTVFGGSKIKNITIGNNSYLSIWKSGLTKLRKEIVSKMSIRIITKGFLGFSLLRLKGSLINGVFSGIIDWIKLLITGNNSMVG